MEMNTANGMYTPILFSICTGPSLQSVASAKALPAQFKGSFPRALMMLPQFSFWANTLTPNPWDARSFSEDTAMRDSKCSSSDTCPFQWSFLSLIALTLWNILGREVQAGWYMTCSQHFLPSTTQVHSLMPQLESPAWGFLHSPVARRPSYGITAIPES